MKLVFNVQFTCSFVESRMELSRHDISARRLPPPCSSPPAIVEDIRDEPSSRRPYIGTVESTVPTSPDRSTPSKRAKFDSHPKFSMLMRQVQFVAWEVSSDWESIIARATWSSRGKRETKWRRPPQPHGIRCRTNFSNERELFASKSRREFRSWESQQLPSAWLPARADQFVTGVLVMR